ncbi:G protein-activated inward rectifier potassium channel 1-like [Sesbania bispinosa]|nr:G protein-activated inward rectifier potassium channel 1-like [Sesbania bispinosa]
MRHGWRRLITAGSGWEEARRNRWKQLDGTGGSSSTEARLGGSSTELADDSWTELGDAADRETKKEKEGFEDSVPYLLTY